MAALGAGEDQRGGGRLELHRLHRLDCVERRAVHQLQQQRLGLVHDPDDGPTRGADVRKAGRHRQSRTRRADKPDADLRDDAKGALRTAEERDQVVAGDVLARPTADPDRAPVGEHHLEAEHGVPRHPVPDTAKAAGVGGDVAADGRELEAGRVRRVGQAGHRGRLLQCPVDETRPDRGLHRVWLKVDDVVHRLGAKDDAAVDRVGAAAEPRARAARHHRYPLLRGDPDRGLDFGRRLRAQEDRRKARRQQAWCGCIAPVGIEHVGIDDDVVDPCPGEALGEVLVPHGWNRIAPYSGSQRRMSVFAS